MGIRADQVATVNNAQMGDHAEWDTYGNFVYDVALKADERIAELEAMIKRLIDDAHRMHMVGPGYRDAAQAMLYAEANKLIGR